MTLKHSLPLLAPQPHTHRLWRLQEVSASHGRHLRLPWRQDRHAEPRHHVLRADALACALHRCAPTGTHREGPPAECRPALGETSPPSKQRPSSRLPASSFFPSLTLAPSISAGKTEGVPATYSYTLPVQASWQVDLFGSLLNASRSTQAQLLRAQAYQQLVRGRVIARGQQLLHAADARSPAPAHPLGCRARRPHLEVMPGAEGTSAVLWSPPCSPPVPTSIR